MSVPIPDNPLSGHCAAIDSNTLYVYSPDHFQSLPIKKNATWSDEATGQSVTDPACVTAVPNGDPSGAALYVIGGDTDASDYMGLQRYYFGNKSWETLTPLANVLQTRTNHSAAYLNDSQSILVYGGSPSDAPTDLSSQTFLISTQPPYNIQSFTSNAPPTNSAILQPWNSSHAVLVGGDATNTAVWLFGPDEGWQQLGTNLSQPLDPAARATIVDGTDGSKVLQVYDMNVSPNTAQGIVLLGAGGQTAATGQTIGSLSTSTTLRRDLSIGNWPAYNSTNAPTTTRSDCSLSQNSDGIVVIAGGNDNDPVLLFDQNRNSWVDAGDFFNSKQLQKPLLPSSTSTSSPTASTTDSPVSTTTAAASAGGESAHDRMLRTLGITLGVLCGIAALFVLLLLFLRWRKMKAKRKNGGNVQEKHVAGDSNRMSFADRGASFMKEAGVSTSELAPPNHDRFASNNTSHNSLAIIAGKFGNQRNTYGQQTKGSFESTTRLVKDRNGNMVPIEQHEMVDIGEKGPITRNGSLAVPGAAAQGTALDKETRIERKRSSGWSKYFATSAPTGPNGLSHLPSAYVKPKTLSTADSEYSGDNHDSRIPSSALVAPLDVDFGKTLDGQRLSHVAQGSPSISDSRDEFVRRGGSVDIRDGQQGVIVDPADPRKSQATSISSYGNRSTISSSMASEYFHESGIHGGVTPWAPGSIHHAAERSVSSIYTAGSIYNPEERRPSRGKGAGFFPGAGTNYRPSKVKMSHAAGPTSEWAAPRMPAAKAEARDSTASDITIFPGASDFEDDGSKENSKPGIQSTALTTGKGNTDMSWLNLGLNKSQS